MADIKLFTMSIEGNVQTNNLML